VHTSKEVTRRTITAEKRVKKEQFKEQKKKWLKTVCPYCDKIIEYSPKRGFKGTIKCPKCEGVFIVPSLNNYLKGK
jgi:hypothetical protein